MLTHSKGLRMNILTYMNAIKRFGRPAKDFLYPWFMSDKYI